RRYQMQPVWRADRPQKGRYREFWQCDADVIGSNSLLNEIDLILIYAEVFTALAVPYEIKLNNRKVLTGIAEVVKGKDQMNAIALSIDKLDKVGDEGVRNELSKYGFTQNEIQLLFEIIQSKGEQQFDELKIKLKDSAEGLKGIEELEHIIHTIAALPNKPVNLSTCFSLARGLTYYTGAIFEVVATAGSIKSSIGGGGRYDNLTGIFGLPDVSGVGISFGLDRIYDVMEDLSLFPDSLQASTTRILCCYFDKSGQAYAINAAAQMRQAGIATEVYPDVVKKIGKQLDYANALNIPFAVIIGENEIKSGKPVLKNLTAGTQQELSLADIITHIQSHLV
ncbi:MAG: histidine--tRNA ligase, partial [Bacteroidota bacterium]